MPITLHRWEAWAGRDDDWRETTGGRGLGRPVADERGAGRSGRPSPEARTAAHFDAIAKDRAQLRLFLRGMPKGGDLHNHLSGAAYAEDFLAWADQGGLCVTTEVLPSIVPGPCAAPGKVSAKALGKANPALYNRAINALSMRNYDPGADGAMASGHDQFFATFGRFGAAGDGQAGGDAGGGPRLCGRRHRRAMSRPR
jgi:adenosine deaminase